MFRAAFSRGEQGLAGLGPAASSFAERGGCFTEYQIIQLERQLCRVGDKLLRSRAIHGPLQSRDNPLQMGVAVLQREDDLDQPIRITWQRRQVESHANELLTRSLGAPQTPCEAQ